MITTAQLHTDINGNGSVLLKVGGTGVQQAVSVMDLITLCVRRERTRRKT